MIMKWDTPAAWPTLVEEISQLTIMIKFITADDVLPIRNEVLREGKLTLDECRFE
jgi:hypothetical protein